MRRLLTLAGLAAGGAALYRRLRGRSSDDITPAPTSSETPSGPTPPAAEQVGRVATPRPAPADAPGPSVSAPVADPDASPAEQPPPASADAPAPAFAADEEGLAESTADPTEALVAEEEAAAAAEAAAIGGRAPQDAGGDPAMEPVYQAGGGDAEGFEAAEAALAENASHGEGRANPITDAFTPEPEGERSTVAHGEPDEVDVSEVVRDPDTGDAERGGEGPGRAHDV